MIAIPGVPPAKIDVQRSAIDIAPTIVDLFGLPREASFEGKSLVPELLGKCGDAGAPETEACAERDVVVDLPTTSDSDKRRAFIHGHQKLIDFGTKEYMLMFDLGEDPEEKHPTMKGDDYDAMVARYRAYKKTINEVPTTGCKEGCLWGTTKPEAGAP
jgi:arylsulfatase A-like enzyme